MELLSRKKIKSPSADGQSAVTPTENTGIKLEAFIFDCFNKSKRMAVLEGPRSEEFSPVKNAPGSDKDSPDTARAMLTEQSKKWLRAGDIEVIKKLVSSPGVTAARKKALIQTRDKSNRQPLHIAAYRDSTEDADICKFLMSMGASNAVKDSAGNTPSEVAGRANRRKSKDVIEEHTDTAPKPRERRRSRDSKEMVPAGMAPAAAPAADAAAGGMGGGD